TLLRLDIRAATLDRMSADAQHVGAFAAADRLARRAVVHIDRQGPLDHAHGSEIAEVRPFAGAEADCMCACLGSLRRSSLAVDRPDIPAVGIREVQLEARRRRSSGLWIEPKSAGYDERALRAGLAAGRAGRPRPQSEPGFTLTT